MVGPTGSQEVNDGSSTRDRHRVYGNWCCLSRWMLLGPVWHGCERHPSKAPQSDCGAEAQAAYEEAMEAPKFDLPPAFDASEVKGKTFAYVGIITNSIIQEKFDAFAEGLESVGAKAIYFDGKGRPDVITQAIESAIAQNVSAIIGDGIDAAALAGSAVAHANAANIPVINMNAGDPGSSLPDGIAANVAPGAFKTGVLQADYLLAKTDCKMNALSVFTSAAKLLADQNTAFKEEVERLCPKDCKVTEIDFDAATYPTSMTPQMQSALQRDPSINAIRARRRHRSVHRDRGPVGQLRGDHDRCAG